MGRRGVDDTMIQILSKGKDITSVIQTVTWSGDVKEVSRTLQFTVSFNELDPTMTKIDLTVGDDVLMQSEGKTLFGGVIHSVERSAGGKTMTYMAYDLLYYVKQSDISRIFDTTPESITRMICDDLNITAGDIVGTGIQVYFPCLHKNAYDAIISAYTYAGRINGKVYIPMMQNINKLAVIEKGQYSGVVMEGTYNLTDSTYKLSSEQVVNKVQITDKEGNVISTKEDLASMNKYGTVQKIYQQEDGKDSNVEAEALLHGIDQSGTASGIGDVRAIAGYSLAIQESKSGLYGLFYIDADSHTWSQGKHEMQLTLNFENMMDEKDVES